MDLLSVIDTLKEYMPYYNSFKKDTTYGDVTYEVPAELLDIAVRGLECLMEIENSCISNINYIECKPENYVFPSDAKWGFKATLALIKDFKKGRVDSSCK